MTRGMRVSIGYPLIRWLFLLGLVLHSGCAKWEGPQHWLVTVEVETPEGLVTGSSIVETQYRPQHEIVYTMDSPRRRLRGEAVAVDTSQGTVLALLNKQGDYGFYRSQMNNFGWAPGPDGRLRRFQIQPTGTAEERATAKIVAGRHESSRAKIKQALAERQSFELLEEGWPRFVLLPDVKDPKSAVSLAPTNTHEAAIGDIRVRRITVQETDEPITRTLAARLPWLTRDALPISGRQVYPPQVPADLLLLEDFSTLLE